MGAADGGAAWIGGQSAATWPSTSIENKVACTLFLLCYLLGKPMAIDSLKDALKNGKQRQRRAAAIELTMRQPGTPLFNCSAPGARQMRLLGL